MLEVKNLSMRFGGLLAVDQVSVDVKEREIVSIIGPNGAGKTTVFNCLSGFYKPSGGQILFEGKEIQGKPDYKISRMGMVRTFQHVRLFGNMTVVENLLVAQHRHVNTNLIAGLLKTPDYRRREKQSLERARYWLDRVGLLEVANREAGNLAYGQQRRLEIARCMVTEPKLLMLDEPAAGLNPAETKELDYLIVSLKEDYNVSVLLIEHDMSLVMGISDRINVISQGRPLASGTPEEVRQNDDVIKAYLGEA
ncbi:high-affinity branched-chain amino acid ABC transporter ATP-binding protein LivG [Marinobacter persicus]|uniref:L-leucine ABC transporter ATP-binding protein /L-isoleucine ABC transporter ATP-binding protein /L-valine ABC transporter ATP-binding protein n=1 Tax=Marinobacter persicus TaxID=930118 RepID=A0A2S6GAZ1_9GAMM|nr:high-affinity branched-chain amino acid ABC transporter ATP-binding protein LivG [Marinobacter persicus]PPK53588.1 L-leucine ABC transporter ATP-binding protein /L-isoleucine ABC transporter ATP-binding protein /L-valine ABC transporter ATP-binding protein [Marinobacter persicus]PPK56402.1 L-leucine ABC transporter ATP-binding protein /L-isoleucine ABC transporter ATP-binding protein /L-valine ABC transporter ATP-binding protein [Marinobacter persicus]PPK59975.1 L-leucine ABC transporter ATP-